ncbi:glycoprotein 3-alpha-L-fucosyltransferase A [Hyalella azteca]|uniref:Fucosyltransferase n=1 Tax=Hyalella azteca TaxID=294128 RepID=A0A8B7NUH5_HYAAZ|nr:glycoprotein 3-alpha-L-fucosyltransferase A [Hyalella azteca]
MVLQSYEAPSLYPANDFARYDGLIDYTMGYRLDSDIVRTSGAVHFKLNSEKLKNDVLQNPNPHPMKKRRMAAWFVSNCKHASSNRMELTKVLQQHGLQVDIYGACGSLQCGTKRTEECYKMVEQEYKFYLSFENSLCNHYVTEKFFTLLRYDVVPVTYGLGQELTGAPKDAYIDVFDFPDVQTLAAYLLYLDSNATAYNEYFRWKQFYEVKKILGESRVCCKLCEILVRGIEPQRQYTNVQAWLSNGQWINATENEELSHFINGSPYLASQALLQPKL